MCKGKYGTRKLLTLPRHFANLLGMLLFYYYSGFKSFRKKSKGKGDDVKLKVKPKKFPKDVKGDHSPGQKRKSTDLDDHRQKTFKEKKWKGAQESQDKRQGHTKLEHKNKKGYKNFSKNDKESHNRTENGTFNKAMKRKLNDIGGSKDFVKKKKPSGTGEHDKGNVLVV